MADEKAPPADPTDVPEPPAKADATAAPEAANDDGSELQALKDEVAALNDQLLRMAAEMDNLRKRTAREINDARHYSIANFARDVLTIGDNLARALGAVPAEARAAGDAGLTALVEGVELTERELQKTLEKHKVVRLSPKGEKFDPNHHQAMFEVESADAPAGTIAEVIQDGYVIGDRVLRPAMVGVAKKPKPADDAPATATQTEADSAAADEEKSE